MKILLKIFNLVYLVIAAVAITCFCTKPYIEINGGYKVQGEQIAEFLPSEIEEYLTKEEIKDIIDQKEVKVTLNIAIPAKLVFNFKDKEATTNTINEMIDVTVENTVEELRPTIHELSVAISKKVANSIIYQAIEKYTEEFKTDPALTDVGEALVEAGIDGPYIENFTEQVYQKLSEDGATIDSVMTVVTYQLTDVVSKLENNNIIPAGSGAELSAESTAEIKNEMETYFKEFGICDEEGNILDIDKAMESLLCGLLDTLIKPDGESDPDSKLVLRGEPTEEDIEETESELTIKVRQLIHKYVDEINIPGYVTDYGLYIFIVTMFLILPWAILALVSLIRTLRKKCWVKTWYVFTFASIQLILGVLLTIATTNFLPKIASVLPLGDLNQVLSSLTLSVKTSSFIPSILYLAMIPFGIVYAIFAHKVKKQYKAEKRAKKAAQ